jgi:hypothetical protein
MSTRANPTNSVMMDCIIYLSPPNIKQDFDLHHVVYLTHIYLILTKFYPTFGYSPYMTSYPNLDIKQIKPAKESSEHKQLLTYSFCLPNTFHCNTILPYAFNSHGQYQEGKIIRQQQTEMNPPNPPPVGIDQVDAIQMMLIQQMANMITELQNQIRQEREKIRQDRLEIRREIRQAQLERQRQQQPPPPPPVPPSYINIYISTTICKTYMLL